ncbi:MAG: TonB-dependent receptor [Blastocatellia bacterium]|nr:TonB-dependent receptor [Blastocatellia bacterium]
MPAFAQAPQPKTEEVVVVSGRTETRLAETPLSLTLIPAQTLRSTAALTLDDVLRNVAGFQIFRRTSSRVANPTTQGVTFRGVGASGASRAQVVIDGLPLNDPFGGWVYWGRVPRLAVERIEVLQGGASDLYGSSALGGVVTIVPRQVPAEKILAAEVSYGTQNSVAASLFSGISFRKWTATLAGDSFDTDGYVPVAKAERGPVDRPATSRFATIQTRVERILSHSGRIFAAASFFRERRENGTKLQPNDILQRHIGLGADWTSRRWGTVNLRGFAARQLSHQDFSAIAATRTAETLTRSQRVPAQQTGLNLQWNRSFHSTFSLVAGTEIAEVRGASNELVFSGGRLSSFANANGKNRSFGFFGHADWKINQQTKASVGIRVDRWRNFAGFRQTGSLQPPLSGLKTDFPEHPEFAASPRASVLFTPRASWSWFVSGFRAFRAPTLNELYRSFRVGNVVTQANDQLRAERLTGVETGLFFQPASLPWRTRATVFWNDVTRPVANVTLSTTPEVITRQRQNLGRTRSWGLEVQAEVRLGNRVTLNGAFQALKAEVAQFPANRTLEGLRIPQTPARQATLQMQWSAPFRLTVAVQGKASSRQFDDDQNRIPLAGFFTTDVFVSRTFRDQIEGFVALENLFNQAIETGKTPVTTVGSPRLVRFGVRFQFLSKNLPQNFKK